MSNTFPPIALSNAWPAAVSHSLVGDAASTRCRKPDPVVASESGRISRAKLALLARFQPHHKAYAVAFKLDTGGGLAVA